MDKFFKLVESIARFFLYKVFRIKLSEESFEKFMQFVKFAIVGLSNSLISYVIYIITLTLLDKNCSQLERHTALSLHVQLANFLGFTISVFNAFYWSNKYVFTEDRENRSVIKTFLKTYVSYAGTGLILASALLYLWTGVLKIPGFIAPLLNLLITVPLNFIINKFWAYKKDSKSHSPSEDNQ